jgi:hypothetical protein
MRNAQWTQGLQHVNEKPYVRLARKDDQESKQHQRKNDWRKPKLLPNPKKRPDFLQGFHQGSTFTLERT